MKKPSAEERAKGAGADLRFLITRKFEASHEAEVARKILKRWGFNTVDAYARAAGVEYGS